MTRSELAALTVDRLRLALNAELEVIVELEGVDMSREAITQRLRDAAEMSKLCLALAPVELR